MGWKASGGVFIEDAEAAVVDGLRKGFSSGCCSHVGGGGVPGWVVGIEIAKDDSVIVGVKELLEV